MKALTDYLKANEMTQAELAKRAGMTPIDVNRYVKGKRKPGVSSLKKLAKATGISLQKLVESL